MALNVLVFVWQLSLTPEAATIAIYQFGMVPAVVFGQASLPPEQTMLPPFATVISSMFLHGGILHLAGNLLFLWIFGDNVEDSMGKFSFLTFYIACGVGAALTQAALDPSSEIPMIGASGAISGVLGAYLILYPRANVRTLIFIVIFIQLVRIPALLVLSFWFIGQLIAGFAVPSDGGGVAFWAHIGGFVVGLALVPVFRHDHVDLWQPQRTKAWSREFHRAQGPWGPRTPPME